MGKKVIEGGELLHSTNERVKEIEIVLKGSVTASNSYMSIKLPYGSIIGLFEEPGGIYRFDYETDDETTIFSYSYNQTSDLASIIKLNPQLSQILTEGAINCVRQVYAANRQIFEDVLAYYNEVVLDNAKLREYCDAAAEVYVPDDYIENLKEPETPDLHNWEAEFFSKITKELFSPGPPFCAGIILYAGRYISYLVNKAEEISESRIRLNQDTAAFKMRVNELKRKASAIEKDEEDAAAKYDSSAESETNIEIKDAYNVITSYAGMDPDFAAAFKKRLDDFAKLSDKTDQGDDVRRLRRQLAEDFYRVYEGAFLKSMDAPAPPLEVKMFFMFGFIDEKLAGERYTSQLAALAETYRSDPQGNILTIYEWLTLVFKKEVEPSKNEFDMEYPAYLKSLYDSGEIKQNQIPVMLASNEERAKFEIHNFFSLTDRITYGRISSFVPFFYEEDHIKDPKESVLRFQDVRGFLDEIRELDYSCFCRDILFSDPKIGVNREFISTEILPYIILMPNSGNRGALWQEISGPKRDTPARMAVPMFSSANNKLMFTKLAGEFRWEMCRREQGVHWNDVTVPSLTSEFADYIQFYRKNRDISPEMREKIKAQLQSARNSAKGVFVSDYMLYLEYESKGSLRLNKVSRGIIFRYCPFPKEKRESLSVSTPAFKDLVDKYNIKIAQRHHLMDIVIQKITKAGHPVPREIEYQNAFIRK
ncbi:MAG: hypothetical protein J5829_01345 [Lachnospiraceae bacterium]|nr:hypothetical protein [Lachnospiraceae bacterium]